MVYLTELQVKAVIVTLGKTARNTKRAELVKCVDKCDLCWKSQHGFLKKSLET